MGCLCFGIKNISGATLSNVQLFQLLHGLTSQHGVYDSRLTMRHFTNGAWKQLVGRVDTATHTISITTSSLSPFMLAVATPNATPKLNISPMGGGSLKLSWTSDTAGWVLEESGNLLDWVPSTRVINTLGNTSEVNMATVGEKVFFRLAHH